ncbi:MAG: DNA-directed RNA polymerase subunit beta' [Planctomycetes bacterium]|nr:DNA-directed RNA polymerase subunit beta' [Planctomycetota bacterium]
MTDSTITANTAEQVPIAPPPPPASLDYQDYKGVSIRLGSPEDFRSSSYGEVKKPETINYRTFRPEKDGLFCERIFGPERDYECHCGKYRGQKHMGIVCDKCGVMVTTSRERRKRMGHISLAAPVAHIWFFSVTPSRIGSLLGMKKNQLERVIYFQDYVVISPGESEFKECQLITEDEYRRARAQYGTSFVAGMGAESIGELLRNMNLPTLASELREALKTCTSRQKMADLVKRLRTVEMLKDSPNDPAWMILDVVPVIPPELRPLVRLDSGNFASSDLNDLYRRLINRNNRLKRLIELNAPEVIIRNEKRMLQQSVDALFDNGRCKRQVMSTSNQPLKSLTDMIKGKQGRFRLNLLGKRVDYSARSVIVVGPELHLHQCGLPKVIALELFQPFIIRRLKELKLAETIKAAKKMLERRDEEVWDILEEVIQGHPILLNRAPTLHRMGIQAFEPVLIEGNAIQLHPLVCPAFNADFDGDQMAVHLPLSYEAQVEAATLMLSPNNVFSPANGNPLISPHQDIILGIFFMTADKAECKNEWQEGKRGGVYADLTELLLANSHGHVEMHSKVQVRLPAGTLLTEKFGDPFRTLEKPERVLTTPGRAIVNDVLPEGMPYYNWALDKKSIHNLIHDCHHLCGRTATLVLLDDLKSLGFKGATRSGMSFAKDDMVIPDDKWSIIEDTQSQVDQVQKDFEEGAITNNERSSKVIDHWTTAREKISTSLLQALQSDRRDGKPYLNPVFVMAHSGARGGVDQIRQLSGMRGLMAKPSGEIIETPIRANFREGLRILEYFSSTHGARKGLADTALKTADSGYLTRKLADVAQNVTITMEDCGTPNGIPKEAVYQGDKMVVPLSQVVRGRVACDTIRDRISDDLVVGKGQILSAKIAKRIEDLGYTKIRVRTPLQCEAGDGLCQKCYGEDLSRGNIAELGLAAGIVAAQSIGEPGTQLTMRTFHIGGTASRALVVSETKVRRGGTVEYHDLKVTKNPDGHTVALSRTGEIIIRDSKGRELDRYAVPVGSILHAENGAKITKSSKLVEWDAHFLPILADFDGKVRFEDVVLGKTMNVEEDPKTGVQRRKIIESKGDLHPQVLLVGKDGEVLYYTALPENAYLEVEDGNQVTAGTMLAKSPRGIGGTQDITGGLPRVTELFEARIPKNPSTMAEIDGIVELGDKRRGKRIILVRNDDLDEEREHLVAQSKHLAVHTGDRVKAGEPLVDGPKPPQDILKIEGPEKLQRYLVDEVQKVYRAQGVGINDKHIEIIVMQMMRKVQVEASGDSKLLPNSLIDRHQFKAIVEEMLEKGETPPSASPMVMGITKASVQSESFISAASFQETTKVLTEASLRGKLDQLQGLKENVILGNLIPAGTGARGLLDNRVQKKVDFTQFGSLSFEREPSILEEIEAEDAKSAE